MRIGVLTGGGDCPGLNPAIRGFVMRSLGLGNECVGILEGWSGAYRGLVAPLGLAEVEEIVSKGGTILGTSRFNPYKKEDGLSRIRNTMRDNRLDCLCALGGEDTLGVAARLHADGVKVVGIPKTMDNDLSCTDFTFGFDSAVSKAVEACAALKDTGASHRRVMVLEVMGRHAGWVALYTAMAAGADGCLIPEVPPDIDELCSRLKTVYSRKRHALVVVSEGVELPGVEEKGEVDEFGHTILKKRGIGERVASLIEKHTGIETRCAVIGHMQRGGSPTVFDRILGLRVGVKAAELAQEGNFGMMAALVGNRVEAVPLRQAVCQLKVVPEEWWHLWTCLVM